MPANLFDLTGKVALITGGNSGIGLGMAKALAAAGADIAIWGTNAAKNAAAREDIAQAGNRVLALECDVGDEAAVDACFARTVEMFGHVDQVPQNELTRFQPRSSYGISKVAGFHLTRNYREAYGMHASSGILFNHESPRRGYEFVTRKITSGVARILSGRAKELPLGNLEAKRDWGHAREYVHAMWLMLQQPSPDDYVIATGETHTVGEFAQTAFAEVGLDYRDFVTGDQRLYRPAEVNILQGDYSKAREKLGWSPAIKFHALVKEMVAADCEAIRSPQR